MTKRRKTGTCAYCGKTDVNTEVEHVFPESWYPDTFPRTEMITVPACAVCNRAFGKIEDRLFIPLAISLPYDHPEIESIKARAYAAMNGARGRSLRDSGFREARRRKVLGNTQIVGASDPIPSAIWSMGTRSVGHLTTPAGVHVYGTPTISGNASDLMAMALKLFKGCYYHTWKRPLPSERFTVAGSVSEDPRPEIEKLVSMPGCIVGGRKPFEFVMMAAPDDSAIVGYFVLWGHHFLRGASALADPMATIDDQ